MQSDIDLSISGGNDTGAGFGKKIVRDTASLITGSVWSRIMGIVAGFVVARVLGPTDFGILKIIDFVPSLAKFGSFGFDSVAQREILHLRGEGAARTIEQHVKDIAFTADYGWSLLLAVLVVISSFFYTQPEVRFGLWISAISLVIGQVGRLYSVIFTVDKRFKIIAQAGVIGMTVSTLIVLTTVYWGRLYSVLGGNLIGGIFSNLYYHRHKNLNFNRAFDFSELCRQFKIALPLAGGTLAFGFFAWVERLQLLRLFGSEQLGIYMLTVSIYELMLLLTNNLLRASIAHLYERLGHKAETQNETEISELVIKPSMLLAYTYSWLGGLMWLIGPLLISWLLPEYVGVGSLLPWLLLILVSRGVSAMPMAAMNSARLNMQIIVMLIWLGASVGFVILTLVGANLGWGILSGAIGKAVAFAIMAVFAYMLTWTYFLGSRRAYILYGLKIILPIITTVVYVVLLNLVWSSNEWNVVFLKIFLFTLAYLPIFYFLDHEIGFFQEVYNIYDELRVKVKLKLKHILNI